MGSQFLFRTTSPKTITHFQTMLGTRDVKNVSKNSATDLTFSRSKTVSVREKKIIQNEKIINFKPGECFAILAEERNGKTLIENQRISGEHYFKKFLDNPVELEETAHNEDEVYQQVYEDIKELLKPKPKKNYDFKKFDI